MTKPLRYLLRGVIADVIILAAIILFVLVNIALSYRGRCGVFWFFGGAGHPCSRSEYVRQEVGFLFFALLGQYGDVVADPAGPQHTSDPRLPDWPTEVRSQRSE